MPLTDVLLFPPMDVFIRAAAWLLMVVVGLVLLLACTNLASFLLAGALDRRREIAVRLALGASRASLVRRLLTETTLLSLAGGGVGTGLAVTLLGLLDTADLPLPLPVALDLDLDRNDLAFTLAVPVAVGALLGLVRRPCTAPGPTSPTPSRARARARGAAGRASSGGATPWSSRSSRSRWCCSSAPAAHASPSWTPSGPQGLGDGPFWDSLSPALSPHLAGLAPFGTGRRSSRSAPETRLPTSSG